MAELQVPSLFWLESKSWRKETWLFIPSLGKRQQEEQIRMKSLTVFLFRFICYAFPGLLPENAFLNCYGNFSLSLIILHTVCQTLKQNVKFPQNKPGTFRMLSRSCQALSIPQQASCTGKDKGGRVNTDDAVLKTGKQ